ncbi:MAG: GntR family transcriptional regulator [Roseiflexus sp.]|nr:MAG: GntR family transcriptional regulator [Roseiflexus sp.]
MQIIPLLRENLLKRHTNMLTPIDHRLFEKAMTYREAAYQAIKQAILDGSLEPGQPLVEERLAEMLQISRTPVREALAILEHEGLIAPVYRRGLFVCKLTRDQVVELFTANEAVEPFLARRAAHYADPEQIAALDALIREGEACAERHDIAGFLRAGRLFHAGVGRAAGNLILAQFVERNEERVDLFLMGYRKAVDVEMMRTSNREHRAIYRAIVARDPDAAARLAIYHLQSVRERFAALVGDDDSDMMTSLSEQTKEQVE